MVGNTHELQNGRTEARDWWMAVANRAKPDTKEGSTAQGFYVLGADGSDYGFNNNRSVERVLGLMDRGLAAFKERPPRKVEIDPASGRYGFARPQDVATVRVFSRVRPVPDGCDPSNENVARDHVWVLPSEMQDLASGKFSEALAMRLCRFHMVDNVRGEPDHWRRDEVLRHEFKVDKDGTLTGSFSMATADGKRGMEGSLTGRLLPDGFRAFASATAWGASTYAPNPPKGKFPMVFAFVVADDKYSRVVAPQAAFHGAEYLGRE